MPVADCLPVDLDADLDPYTRYTLTRNERILLMAIARRMSTSARLAACGLFAAGKDADGLVTGHVTRDTEHGQPVATFGNLARCGAAWLCPWCATKVRAARSTELDDLVSPFLARGGQAVYAVFTIAGERGEDIATTASAVDRVWKRFTRLLADRDARKNCEVIGDICGWEFTVRLDGSGHPHRNAIYLLAPGADVDRWRAELLTAWHRAVHDCGRRSHTEHGLRIIDVALDEHGRIRELADYVTKGAESSPASRWSLTDELTRQDSKTSRSAETYAPFDLLRLFRDTGETGARTAWQAYEAACKGRAIARMSRGLANRLRTFTAGEQLTLDTDVDDQADEHEALDLEAGLIDEAPEHSPAVVAFDHHAWRFIRHNGLEVAVLTILETIDEPELSAVKACRALFQRCRAPGQALAGIQQPIPPTPGVS